MGGHRFDDLTRAFSTGASRRRLLRGLVGGAAGALAGALGRRRAGAQACADYGRVCTFSRCCATPDADCVCYQNGHCRCLCPAGTSFVDGACVAPTTPTTPTTVPPTTTTTTTTVAPTTTTTTVPPTTTTTVAPTTTTTPPTTTTTTVAPTTTTTTTTTTTAGPTCIEIFEACPADCPSASLGAPCAACCGGFCFSAINCLAGGPAPCC